MQTQTFVIGMGPDNGGDAQEQGEIANAALRLTFPIQVHLRNLLPRDLSFPEVDVYLRHCAAPEGSACVATVASADLLMRLASAAQQIAQLNGAQTGAMQMDVPVADDPASDPPGAGGPDGDKEPVSAATGARRARK